MVRGRRRLIVPVGLAVGWELVMDNRVVVVREVREHHVVVTHQDGSTETVDIDREDTDENSQDPDRVRI
jgi:hypothetical protein